MKKGRPARKKTSLQAAIILRGRTVPIHATTADLSLGGCYIENMSTLPLGAHLTMTLWIGEDKLQISGIVKTCDPVFGNGIQFVDIDLPTKPSCSAISTRRPKPERRCNVGLAFAKQRMPEKSNSETSDVPVSSPFCSYPTDLSILPE